MASKAAKSKPNREVRALKEEVRSLIRRVEAGDLSPTPANTMLRGFSVLIEMLKLERGIYVEEDLSRRVEELKREYGATG